MTIASEALWTRLTGFAGLSALIGSRLYIATLPQDPTYPAVTFQRVSGRREHQLSGGTDLANPRYQFDAWSTSALEAEQVAEQIRLALQSWQATVSGVEFDAAVLLSGGDVLFEPDLAVYRVRSDFSIWHHEPTA